MTTPEKETKIVQVVFKPETPEYSDSANQYKEIWSQDGQIIIQKMEEITKLHFPESYIEVDIVNGPSYSGTLNNKQKMKLRYSYNLGHKKASLVHELLHRHLSGNRISTLGRDSHYVLDLVLYDIWIEIYGKELADKAVEIESNYKGPLADYKDAWAEALSLSKEERQQKFELIKNLNSENNP